MNTPEPGVVYAIFGVNSNAPNDLLGIAFTLETARIKARTLFQMPHAGATIRIYRYTEDDQDFVETLNR